MCFSSVSFSPFFSFVLSLSFLPFFFFARPVPSLPSALSLSLSLSLQRRKYHVDRRGGSKRTSSSLPPTDLLEGSKEERTPVHAYNFRVVALSQSLWNNDRRNGCFVRPIFTETQNTNSSIRFHFYLFFFFFSPFLSFFFIPVIYSFIYTVPPCFFFLPFPLPPPPFLSLYISSFLISHYFFFLFFCFLLKGCQ